MIVYGAMKENGKESLRPYCAVITYRKVSKIWKGSGMWDLRFSQQYCRRCKSSGMWRCVIGQEVADISKEYSMFIFNGQAVPEE